MSNQSLSKRKMIAANHKLEQKEYWIENIGGKLEKPPFQYDYINSGDKYKLENLSFKWDGELLDKLNKLSNNSDPRLHMLLLTGVVILINKYTSANDIIVGTSIYKQDGDGDFINTFLPIRNKLGDNKTCKELLLGVKDSIINGVKNQDYPIDLLLKELTGNDGDNIGSLINVVVLLENIQERKYLEGVRSNIIFSFCRKEEELTCTLEYNSMCFSESTMTAFVRHYENILLQMLSNIGSYVSSLEILSEKEKEKILCDFNRTEMDYPESDKTIHELVEEQVLKTPQELALIFNGNKFEYGEINRKANKLAHYLRGKGVIPETVIGLMMDRSDDMIVSLLAILKAGGAYLPIDPLFPEERVLHMLRDSGAKFLLSESQTLKKINYTILQGLDLDVEVKIRKTELLGNIRDFDSLPMPDRSLINLESYRDKIGMASVTNSISIQSTRGCPYKCIYCHKVWSKNHVYRSADNIFNEVEFYYKKGVRNFEFIDDIFNLNRENSVRFFKLVIKNGLKINIFFPNGLRGDLLTPDYIDLMYKAGTRNINLSLETASPRLQKLIKKNLDIDKLKNALDYISNTYPDIILELASMHGFPTETEEEALMTLDFIKDIKWLHFPYIHILKIYPNTEMEELALNSGVLKQDILSSRNLAYHELPETLPFPKSFTRKYQASFLNDYFFDKERLKHVWPIQNRILSQEAIIQKYDAYLPTEIKSVDDIKEFLDIGDIPDEIRTEDMDSSINFFSRRTVVEENTSGRRILFLDLSNHFTGEDELYGVAEQPLGLLYLLTHLKSRFKHKIDGRIYKSGFDFNNFAELRELIEAYNPELIGIRTLTYYKEFFHETVALIKQWCKDVPVFAGGPYATSEYDTLLKDDKIDLAIIGEGEYVLEDLIGKMLENDFKLPESDVLGRIGSLAYVEKREKDNSREIILLDQLKGEIEEEEDSNPPINTTGDNLAYVMYTSGSTGLPKGVMVEHRQVNNCIFWMQDKFNLGSGKTVLQRTNLTFDPSVWEIFWPLYVGANIHLVSYYQGKDPDFLINLLNENPDIAVMYCPASLASMMAFVLKQSNIGLNINLPYLLVGAEPISRDVVNTLYEYFDGEIVNTYGPTECTINNTYFDLERNSKREIVPIGYPVANNRIYIVSKDFSLLPVNQKGEICISGLSLARGYINNPAYTDNSFIDNPFGEGRLYKTGDSGRWLEDGTIEISGRIDEQVKIRGYRIEPGEIENVLLKHGNINDCSVVVRNKQDDKEAVKICRNCGITTEYPNTQISGEGSCNICSSLSDLQQYNKQYFKVLEDLDSQINQANSQERGEYDCILLYSGGRGAAYALYNLADRGHKVLALTYDNGYFAKSDLENIKMVTSKLGVDNVVITHNNSDLILRESLNSAKTVCNGCFHTSSSIGLEYAYRNNIQVVIGATLSRGQIIENKLIPYYLSGTTDTSEIERELSVLRQNTPQMNKRIFDLIDFDVVTDQSVFSKVKSLDFYRYCDVSNSDMIRYLNNKDPYWKNKKDYAIYSTNCPIKQIGDFIHLEEKGYHYYGSATSWEKRQNHINLQNLSEDLTCSATKQGAGNYSRRIGYVKENLITEPDDYLCAYCVTGDGLETSEIRNYLSLHLPEYSVPSHFLTLDNIPLTSNGKVDKKALPKPEAGAGSEVEYVAAENDIEKILVNIWKDILGLERTPGIDDNFFELGGDSIKAIQIMSRLSQENYKGDIASLFNSQTIREFAPLVKEETRIIDQSTVTGSVPLSPIQKWFFNDFKAPKHHFNQAVLLIFKEPINVDKLKALNQSAKELARHHDALRMSYREIDGVVDQENRGDAELYFKEYDLKDEPDPLQKMEEIATGVQNSFILENDTLIRFVFFNLKDGCRLLIVAHHLVIDGVSWRILIEDLESGYRQAIKGDQIKLPLKTDSYMAWSKKLTEYSQSNNFKKERVFWKEIDLELRSILPDFEAIDNRDKVVSSFSLTVEDTEKLLLKTNQAFSTGINDILLTALARAITKWSGEKIIPIELESHGRSERFKNMDISRTVGWFTSKYPVVLETYNTDDISEDIISVKESLRKIPDNGLGYGIYKYLTDGNQGDQINKPEILFNYLGQFDTDLETNLFGIAIEPTGENVSSEALSFNKLNFNGMIASGQFAMNLDSDIYPLGVIDHIQDLFKKELKDIIQYTERRLQLVDELQDNTDLPVDSKVEEVFI